MIKKAPVICLLFLAAGFLLARFFYGETYDTASKNLAFSRELVASSKADEALEAMKLRGKLEAQVEELKLEKGKFTIYPSDPNNDCRMPELPTEPITDRDISELLLNFELRVNLCRILLGHK